MDIRSSCFRIKGVDVYLEQFFLLYFFKSKLHEIHAKGKLTWNPPWSPVKSFCLCSETDREPLCLLKYTWKKWMYFFLQRTVCFTQWWGGGNICVMLCVSVLKSTDTVCIWKMTDCQSCYYVFFFSGKWGPSFAPGLFCANEHVMPTCILSLVRHFFRHAYREGKMLWWVCPSRSRWENVLHFLAN